MIQAGQKRILKFSACACKELKRKDGSYYGI